MAQCKNRGHKCSLTTWFCGLTMYGYECLSVFYEFYSKTQGEV